MEQFLNIKAAFSPCPNDVFLFYPWKENKIKSSLKLDINTFDINTLNELAKIQAYPLIKISAALYPKVMKYYEILPVGITLGYNCGPLLIKSSYNKLKTIEYLGSPGKDTTAHKLFNRYFSYKKCIFLSYDKIYSAVQKQEVDSGILIHESRFKLFKEILISADLGELWFQETSLPLPLGCIAIARSLPFKLKQTIISILKESFLYSQTFLESTILFSRNFSQEKDLNIIKKFIDTYVSQEIYSISSQGISALEYFWNHISAKNWLIL